MKIFYSSKLNFYLTPINEGKVTFSDNVKSKVINIEIVGKLLNSHIDDALYIEGLKHNLLSISQFCDKGNQVIFSANKCLVVNDNDKQIKLVGKRINNVYMIDLVSKYNLDMSLVNVNEDSWI